MVDGDDDADDAIVAQNGSAGAMKDDARATASAMASMLSPRGEHDGSGRAPYLYWKCASMETGEEAPSCERQRDDSSFHHQSVCKGSD